MSIAPVIPVSIDEFLRREAEAPEGTSLELINGELVERPMTTRRPSQTRASARIAQHLLNCVDEHPEVPGTVDVGEVRCLLRRNPDTIVGVDVGFWKGEEYVDLPPETAYYDGPPLVAIEILSPTDTHESVIDKLRSISHAASNRSGLSIRICKPSRCTALTGSSFFLPDKHLSPSRNFPVFAYQSANCSIHGSRRVDRCHYFVPNAQKPHQRRPDRNCT